MASLGIHNIRKTYGKNVEVLKGINLDIADGEFISLVGPSGSIWPNAGTPRRRVR